MARPTALTPEVHEQVIGLLRQGHTQADAAIAVDVRPETISEWIRRGNEKGDEPYATFAADVRKARVSLKVLATNTVVKAMRSEDENTRLRAGTFVLERRFPEQWSEKVRHTVSNALDEALEALEQEFHGEPEILQRIARCLAEGASGEPVGEPAGSRVH